MLFSSLRIFSQVIDTPFCGSRLQLSRGVFSFMMKPHLQSLPLSQMPLPCDPFMAPSLHGILFFRHFELIPRFLCPRIIHNDVKSHPFPPWLPSSFPIVMDRFPLLSSHLSVARHSALSLCIFSDALFGLVPWFRGLTSIFYPASKLILSLSEILQPLYRDGVCPPILSPLRYVSYVLIFFHAPSFRFTRSYSTLIRSPRKPPPPAQP